MNIVDSKKTFKELNIKTPDIILTQIKQLEYYLDNARTNREYDSISSEITNLKQNLNDKIFSNVDYNNFTILKNSYDYYPLHENKTVYDALTYAYNHLNGDGMKVMSQILLNMGIDGYIIDNVYVIINFDKLNQNVVKDKNKLFYDAYINL